MILKINEKKLDSFLSFDADLGYDNMGDTFSFSATFDPENPDHVASFRPLSYALIEVFDGDLLLLTGTAVSFAFADTSKNSTVQVSGYSKPGVLEDVTMGVGEYPLQFDGMTLEKITEALIAPHGLTLLLDPLSSRPATAARIEYPKVKVKRQDKKKQILTELAAQRNVIWTSNPKGELVLTTPNTSAAPVADFSSGSTGVKISSSFNGQSQHSEITAVRQASRKSSPAKGTASRSDISTYRPTVVEMTAGENTGAVSVAESARASEYLGNVITVELDRKRLLNDKLAYPGQIVTVNAPGAYVLKKTRFFVRRVSIHEDASVETATLTCIYPESLTGGEVQF